MHEKRKINRRNEKGGENGMKTRKKIQIKNEKREWKKNIGEKNERRKWNKNEISWIEK